MFPCGVIVTLSELFRAESKSQVYGVLHEFLSNHSNVAANLSKMHTCIFFLPIILSEYICYDDGCHLRKYARNDKRKNLTQVSKQLADTEIVVDKLHMKGHIDTWCHRNCDPNNFPELNNVSIL